MLSSLSLHPLYSIVEIIIAPIRNVEASISIAAPTPREAIMIPAAPIPMISNIFETVRLRLVAVTKCSSSISSGTNEDDAGRLNDSTVVMRRVNPAMIYGFTISK